jgi:hypothetical protein
MRAQARAPGPTPAAGGAPRSPLAATGFMEPPKAALPAEEPEESTRSVDREELFRQQDAHVIVGEDAIGDEATLALGPGQVEAALGALPQPPPGMGFDKTMLPGAGGAPAFPPPPSPFGATPAPMPAAGLPMPQQPQRAPMQSWPGDGGGAAPQYPQPQPPAWGEQTAPPVGYQVPPSNPGMQAAHPASGGYALSPPGQGYGRPGMVPTQAASNAPWPAAPNTPQSQMSAKARNQIIILAVVGVICLAIFATGIYLFVTTMNRPGG